MLPEKEKSNPSQQRLKDMLQSDGPMGGHSDHDAWGEPSDHKNLNNGINAASDIELESHSIDIERQVKQAFDKQMRNKRVSYLDIFLKLLNEWIKSEQPSVDWRKELRLLFLQIQSTTIKKDISKKKIKDISTG